MVPRVARLLALVAALLVLVRGGGAAADVPEAPVATPPRDVAVVVQPAAARLPPPPEEFIRAERTEGAWLVIEAPSSIRDRVDALARDAEAFRSRLAADLGQPVLDHILVRIARNPAQMAELAPTDSPPF